jgi:Na+/H+-dicarboxylate symporter
MKGQNKLFIAIIVALIIGVIMGGVVHTQYPDSAPGFAKNIKLLGTMFIRLVQMIIAPLVFTTLVVGIAKMSDIKMIGRVGSKAMLWFITASLVSLFIGLAFVNWLEPGLVMQLEKPAADAASEVLATSNGLSLEQFVNHIIPKSLFEAFATNEVLQIVVFSIMFGIALANMGEQYTKPIVRALDICAHAILKMVGYIMWFAPLGVLGAIAATVATNGFEIFKVYAIYLRDFFFALAVLWLVLCIVGYLILGNRLFELMRRIKAPLLIAFSTTSSEAVFPKLVEELERFGCNNRIVSFILPLGYSFNLDGSMMYMTFAAIFIAQIYGIDMSLGQQIIMLLVLMLTSKGIAGVPRASLVIIVATCTMFGIPPEGIALILPIDHFCDMGRSMTNVLGNALATSAVSKWEGQLDDHGGDLYPQKILKKNYRLKAGFFQFCQLVFILNYSSHLVMLSDVSPKSVLFSRRKILICHLHRHLPAF